VTLDATGIKVSGEGVCFANSALHQDQCYFEVTLVKFDQGSEFSIGVAHRLPEVFNKPLGDLEHSWCFKSSQSTEPFASGDVLGCIFDQVSGRPTLKLSRNGENLPPGAEVKGFRGTVFPAVGVTHGCELSCKLNLDLLEPCFH